MKPRSRRALGGWLAPLVLSLFLAGCATGPSPGGSQSSARERADIYLDLGVSYLQQGRTREALSNLKKARDLREGDAQIHNALGLAYQRLGFKKKAGRNFRRAVELAPENGEVLNNYGVFLANRGSYDKARKQFQKALENPLYSSPESAYYNLAWLARQQDRPKRAEDMLRTALRLQPGYAEARLALARLFRDRGRLSDARDQVRQLLESRPEHIRAHLLAGEIALELGDRSAARDHLNRVKDLAGSRDDQLVQRSRKLLRGLESESGP